MYTINISEFSKKEQETMSELKFVEFIQIFTNYNEVCEEANIELKVLVYFFNEKIVDYYN